MIDKEKLQNIIEEKLNGTDKFLVALKILPGNRITVSIDSDSFVIIDDCAGLSRHIESQLDREVEDFELEVSSAGLSQPLVLPRQYRKNAGREIKVTMKDGDVIKGIISEASDAGFTLLEKKSVRENNKKVIIENTVKIAFSQIKEAKIVINI